MFYSLILFTMNNTMKKSTALLVAGGLTVGGALAAELTTTEKGKEIIKNLEGEQIKYWGEQTSETTAKFNDRVKGVLFKKEENKENDEPKLDESLGAGDPPLKIGNIIINENDILTSLTNELGIRGPDATQFARDIVAIRNTEYQSQYKKVIDRIDKFVAEGKITSKQGWALMLYITNDARFREVFDENHEMTKLFNEALEDKNVQEFYDFGNKKGLIKSDLSSGYGNLSASTGGYSNNSAETVDDDDWGEDEVDFSEENAEIDKMNAETKKMIAEAKARTQKMFEEKEKSKNELLVELRKFVAAGGNPATEFDWYEGWARDNGIEPDDLVK